MALDPYDYDEQDRPNAFKSRKKTGKWCKGKRGVECDYTTVSTLDCMWVVTTPRYNRNGPQQRAFWKCGCETRCKKCGRMLHGRYRFAPRNGCINTLNKYKTMPRDPDIHISPYGW